MKKKIPGIIIKQLDIYTPILKKDKKTCIEKKYNDKYDIDTYINFPLFLEDNNTLWKYGNLFLMNKIKKNSEIDSETLYSNRSVLGLFKKWVDKNNIDYLSSPKRKFLGPVYMYRRYLNEELDNGNIAPKTLQNRIGIVVQFYEFLIEEGFKFDFPLWSSSITSVAIRDREGFSTIIKKITRDVSIVKNSRVQNDTGTSILDGGNLIPLKKEIQILLINILKKSSNIEMRLGFFIALTTGARIQSVFTLRVKHFDRLPSENEKSIKIKIGDGTLCDSKYGKQNILILPIYVYKMVRVYIKSIRAQCRRNKTKHIFEDKKKNYVFMNNRGVPYYCSKTDPYGRLYVNKINGSAVRTFISTTLKKEFKKHGVNFTHSFHDLRATFLMNYYDSNIIFVDRKLKTISSILIEMMQLAGHSSITITERYMNFKNSNKEKEYMQDDFENYLKEQILE